MTEKRHFIKWVDILVLASIVVTCCIVYFVFLNMRNNGEVYAEIYYDGKVIQKIKLSDAEDKTFNLAEQPKVNFEIKDHKIRFVNVSCPDKICEKNGFLGNANDVAICLPNKVTLRLTADSTSSTEYDAVVN